MLKQIANLLVLVILTSTSLLAQRGHHRHLPEMTEEVKTTLALTAEQVNALEALQQTTKNDLQAMHERSDLDHEARRAAARAIFEQAKTSRNEILNVEQQAQLKAIRAQHHEERHERMAKVDHKSLRAELREYRKTEIQPVMKAQRAKLDNDLSTEDQQKLEEIRATLKTAREAARAEHKEKRAEHTEQEGEHVRRKGHKRRGHHGKRNHHHQGRSMHHLAEKQPEEFVELNAMVVKYDEEITALLEELSPKHQEWKADQRAIAERYLPEGEHPRGKHHRPHHEKNDEHAERKQLMRKIDFLLKNSNTNDEEEVASSTVERITAQTYPNPATNTTTLAFELPTPLELAIDVRDENGNLVKKVTQEPFAIGKHEVNIDVSDLKNGTYYLTLSGKQLRTPQSVKVVVLK